MDAVEADPVDVAMPTARSGVRGKLLHGIEFPHQERAAVAGAGVAVIAARLLVARPALTHTVSQGKHAIANEDRAADRAVLLDGDGDGRFGLAGNLASVEVRGRPRQGVRLTVTSVDDDPGVRCPYLEWLELERGLVAVDQWDMFKDEFSIVAGTPRQPGNHGLVHKIGRHGHERQRGKDRRSGDEKQCQVSSHGVDLLGNRLVSTNALTADSEARGSRLHRLEV